MSRNSPPPVDRRALTNLGGFAVAALLFAAGLRLTPPADVTVAGGLAGLPRLGLYMAAAAVLVLTAANCFPFAEMAVRKDGKGAGMPARLGNVLGWLGLGLGLVLACALTAFNTSRLTAAMADPLGPPLWIGAMLAVMLATLGSPAGRRSFFNRWPGQSPESAAGSGRRIKPYILLGTLLALAVALRFVMLGDIPIGIMSDEGDRAAQAMGVLDGTAPKAWFDSGWYRINMVYFQLLAVFLSLFGISPAGARMLSAVCGFLLVLVVAWIGIRQFGWRTGLLATALAAANTLAVQHSRFISEATVTALLWGVSLAGFMEGGRSGRLWPFALAGLAGGLGLYFYPSGNLWPVGAVLSVIVLWLQTSKGRRWGIARGAMVAAVASLIAAGPFIAHMQKYPNEPTLRYTETTILSRDNQTRLHYLRATPLPLHEVLTLQVERSIGMFDRYGDGVGLLPMRAPAFPAPMGGLAVMGIAYLLLRSWRDSRFALLSIWFWLSLSGIILTVETPSYLRGAGGVATLPFLIALPLVDIAGRAVRLVSGVWGLQARSRPALDPRREALANGTVLAVAAVALIAIQTVYYFQKLDVMAESWSPPNNEARYIAELGKNGPVYSLEMSEHMTKAGWVKFLAAETPRGQVPNVGQDLPAVAAAPADYSPSPTAKRTGPPVPAAGQGLSFIFYPNANQPPYLGLLQALYPGGVALPKVDQRWAYQVPAEVIRRSQGVTALTGEGTALVSTFGVSPPNLAAAGPITWRAGIRLPQSNRYLFRVSSNRPARLNIDGTTVISGDGRQSVIGEVYAARGLHFVELIAEGSGAGDQITLERTPPLGKAKEGEFRPFAPEEAFAPMDAPWGLLGRVVRDTPANNADERLSELFLDSTLAATFLNHYVPIYRTPFTVEWRGSLVVPKAGSYRMAFASDGKATLQIDGRASNVATVKPEAWQTVGEGTEVPLTEGVHEVRVSLLMGGGGRNLIRWNWAPPLADGRSDAAREWTVVPPQVLRAETAVWSAPPSGQ